MVQFCGKAVTSMKAMTEGGRRVLLVAAKTTPLMIRDAMTGEWQCLGVMVDAQSLCWQEREDV